MRVVAARSATRAGPLGPRASMSSVLTLETPAGSGPGISADVTPRGPAAGRGRDGEQRGRRDPVRSDGVVGEIDADAGVLSAETSSTMCVRRFHGSRRSAIHDTHRVSRRSSSTREPSHPPPKVFDCLLGWRRPTAAPHTTFATEKRGNTQRVRRDGMLKTTHGSNDPSAGSPTETLLRLLHHLDDRVQPVSRPTRRPAAPLASPGRPICRSDGRCVQRAGT